MQKKILIAVIVLSFVASYAGKAFLNRETDAARDTTRATPYARIISMAPSTTETLYALGLGDRVVGVTRYCTYPPETADVTKVGGFLDPNFEAIVALRPDLVIVLPVHGDTRGRLRELGIETLEVDHRTLDGILDSLNIIGNASDATPKANAILADIHARVDRVRAATAGLPKPRVLISAGRNAGAGELQEVYVAGKGQWYDDVIEMAGGVNAFENEAIQFPSLTGEGLLRLDPDVVVELIRNLDAMDFTEADVVREWGTLPDMQAVQTGRVHVLGQDYVTIPGPRFINTVEDLARLLHPGADWSAQ